MPNRAPAHRLRNRDRLGGAAVLRLFPVLVLLLSGGCTLPGGNETGVNGTPTPVRRDGRVGYIDGRGNVQLPPRYDTGGLFSEGVAAVASDGTWRYVDAKGREAIPGPFTWAGPFEDGRAVVCLRTGYGIIDRTGNVVVPPTLPYISFSTWDGLRRIRSEEGWGYMDGTGRTVVRPVYAESRLRYPAEGRIPFATELPTPDPRFGDSDWSRVRWGYLDYEGRIVVPPRFLAAMGFRGGKAIVLTTDVRHAVIDGSGRLQLLLPEALQPEWAGENLLWVRGVTLLPESDNPEAVRGKRVDEVPLTRGVPFALSRAALVSDKGIYVTGFEFLKAGPFSMTCARVRMPEGWTFIDRGGNPLTDARYLDAEWFTEDRAAVRTETGWGFIDKEFRFVVQPRYERVDCFRNGLAPVRLKGKWAYINVEGRTVTGFVYDSPPDF